MGSVPDGHFGQDHALAVHGRIAHSAGQAGAKPRRLRLSTAFVRPVRQGLTSERSGTASRPSTEVDTGAPGADSECACPGIALVRLEPGAKLVIGPRMTQFVRPGIDLPAMIVLCRGRRWRRRTEDNGALA